MQPRTKRQNEVLNFINEFIERKGYKPSYQQIARQLGISSKSAVAKHIFALEQQGILRRRRDDGGFDLQVGSANPINDAVCEIQWLETPFPGLFREKFEDETLFVPRFLLGVVKPERICAFRVPTDAMIGEHIREGDIALIEKRSFARDGACVVAAVESRVVLKKYFRVGSSVELRPTNKNFSTIKLSAEKVLLLGVFRGLLRPFN